MGFDIVFAFAVTLSVQLVGLYLVFTTLIVPALATLRIVRRRAAIAYAISALGYVGGLVVATVTDLAARPAIVWVMTIVAMAFAWTRTCRAR